MSPATSWLRPVRTWATTSSKARAGTARAVPPVPSGQEALAQGGLAVDAAGLERADALFQRRVAEHQPAQAVAHRTADAESRDLLGQGVLALVERQALQRRDHLLAAGERGAAGVGAELAMAREPHRDHAREQAEHHVEHELYG